MNLDSWNIQRASEREPPSSFAEGSGLHGRFSASIAQVTGPLQTLVVCLLRPRTAIESSDPQAPVSTSLHRGQGQAGSDWGVPFWGFWPPSSLLACFFTYRNEDTGLRQHFPALKPCLSSPLVPPVHTLSQILGHPHLSLTGFPCLFSFLYYGLYAQTIFYCFFHPPKRKSCYRG